MATTKTKPGANVPATTGNDANLPAYLQGRENTGSGLQGLDSSDFIVPRIKLLQKISKEPDNFEAAVPGIFWLNVLDVPLGPELEFIVISNKKRYLLMPPLAPGNAKGIFARADDGVHWRPDHGSWEIKLKGQKQSVKWEINDPTVRGSGLAEYGSSNPEDADSVPAATLFHEYLVYLPEHPHVSPVLLSLARSQVKVAKDLNGKIEFSNQPMQALKFKASIVTASNGEDQEYYNYQFVRSGFASEDQFKGCLNLAEKFTDYRGADEEGAAEEARGGGGRKGPSDSKEF